MRSRSQACGWQNDRGERIAIMKRRLVFAACTAVALSVADARGERLRHPVCSGPTEAVMCTCFLSPIWPYAVRGIVWDQGESGTGAPGVTQQDLLAALVAGWRDAWANRELLFIYIRKVQYGDGPAFTDFTKRMSHVPNCWMVDNEGLSHVTHPPDKLEYAKRLFRVMMGHIYRDETSPDKL